MSDNNESSAPPSGSRRIEPTLSQLEKVDQNAIHILENVVEERIAPTHDGLPSRQVLAETIRTTLKTQLHDELHSIIQPAIAAAVEQAATRLETVIKDELSYSLQQRLNELIKEALKKQFGNCNQSEDTGSGDGVHKSSDQSRFLLD